MSNISPRQFGTKPVPMPSTVGSFGSGSSGFKPPVKMITPKLGGSMGSPTKPVKMPTKVFGR
jgi:hypothetical protein